MVQDYGCDKELYECDEELKELMAKLRQTIKQVKSQLSIIEDTVSTCEIIEERKYKECVNAMSMAEVEAIKFMKLNVELVTLLNNIRNDVFNKHL
jgi:hypothetical protein